MAQPHDADVVCCRVASLIVFVTLRDAPRRPAPRRSDFRQSHVFRGGGCDRDNYFALFGFIFLITQYFQLIRGYSALSAGMHTLPFAAS